MIWAMIKENVDIICLYRVKKEHNTDKGSRWVMVRLQGINIRFFQKTGCRYTLITPSLPPRRAPSARDGSTWWRGIGQRPLLGDKDTYRLGIITFREEGREPT